MDLDWVHGDPVELRAAYAAERAALVKDAPDDVRVAVLEREALSGLTFTPKEGGRGTPILYFHGGSWMLGSPQTHYTLPAWLARETGRVVYSVRYPLAPEHPAPAQRLAAKAALRAMAEFADSIFVAGDSAGGAMALWAAGGATSHVAGVACFYPAYGLTQSTSIDDHGAGNPALNALAIAKMYERLGQTGAELQDSSSKAGAPLLILAAGKDPLRDDCEKLASDMAARDVTLWEANDAPHAFLHDAGTVLEARRWLHRTAEWMASLDPP